MKLFEVCVDGVSSSSEGRVAETYAVIAAHPREAEWSIFRTLFTGGFEFSDLDVNKPFEVTAIERYDNAPMLVSGEYLPEVEVKEYAKTPCQDDTPSTHDGCCYQVRVANSFVQSEEQHFTVFGDKLYGELGALGFHSTIKWDSANCGHVSTEGAWATITHM